MPGLAARRNAHHLAPIKTSFNERPIMNTLHDSAVAGPPTDDVKQPVAEDAPKPDTVLKPRKSRTSLFDLFSKPNVERSRGHREPLPPMPEIPKERSTLSKRLPRTVSEEEPNTLGSKASRPQLKTSKSARSIRTAFKKDYQARHHFKAPWHPPPLFQAYPQSLKHSSLEAPGSSHGHPSGGDKTSFPSGDGPGVPEEETVKNRKFFGRMKSRPRLREDYDKAKTQSPTPAQTWSRKVYVLVTAGYLLQYAGDGPFDRLPEKILKLSPASAAFASDAIEGKHWVLEVLQSAKADDFAVQAEQKTFRSWFGVQTSYARRLTSTMLLVFGTPEEMDSWMVSIRKEIGNDENKPRREAVVYEAAEAPTIHRYSSIVRHPSKHSDPTSPQPDTAESSPTVVESQRASSTLVASASSGTFSSRFSRQLSPNQMLRDSRTLSVVSSRSDRAVIGPALTSPGFFERHRTPMTGEFPDSTWPRSRLDDNSTYPASPTTLSTLGPNHYSSSLDRRRSIHSLSSKSSNLGGESDALDIKHQAIQQRHSMTNIREGAETLDVKSASLLPSVPPSPGLQHFPEPPRRSITAPNEMESIAESPPLFKAGGYPGAQAIASAHGITEHRRIPYTRASASFTPGSATLINGVRTAKPNSVFARPIPIATPSPSSATANTMASSDPPTRRTSMRDTPPLSNRTSIYQELPVSPSSSSTSGRASQENTLRRPISLRISSDHAPFLATARQSPRASVLGAASADPQTSHRVPVVRPPNIRTGPRARALASHPHYPPPKPPPTMPLPAPPMPTS